MEEQQAVAGVSERAEKMPTLKEREREIATSGSPLCLGPSTARAERVT